MWGLAAKGICRHDGKILLLKIRSKSSHDAGLWEFPGGKVKKNEFFDGALKREFREETGLDVEVESLYNVIQRDYTACKTNQEIKSIQLIMNVSCTSDKVIISEEHDDFGWFREPEILQMIDDGLLAVAAVKAFKKE